ncbi:MAG: respiratory nitrate reductase subunit gamma [Actinomycetales bacterium]|nr:respiratory nitrate reductase subunit gamma [Actinomycetales bacterium]
MRNWRLTPANEWKDAGQWSWCLSWGVSTRSPVDRHRASTVLASLIPIASPISHLGILAVLMGHIMGLLFPESWTNAVG